jgi:hypothetical protein
LGTRAINSYILGGAFAGATGGTLEENQSLARRKAMRTVTISDELFEELKGFVVDPFDDTPDLVIGRLISIVNKAKSRWSPLEDCEAPGEAPSATSSEPHGAPKARNVKLEDLPQEDEPVVVL